ncbi:hypothetical protein Tco_1253589 [Tanacetum coccineum]
MNNLEKKLNNEILHEKDSKSALSVIKVQFDKFIHSEMPKSRNKCNDKRTSGDDTDIIPSYDTKPMVEVPYTAEYNVFGVETQHSEQLESISNTCVVEKVDSNVITD